MTADNLLNFLLIPFSLLFFSDAHFSQFLLRTAVSVPYRSRVWTCLSPPLPYLEYPGVLGCDGNVQFFLQKNKPYPTHGTTQSQNTRATLKPRAYAQHYRNRPDLQLLLITVAFLCRILTELPIYESLTNHSYIKFLQYYLSYRITFFPYFVNHFVLK